MSERRGVGMRGSGTGMKVVRFSGERGEFGKQVEIEG